MKNLVKAVLVGSSMAMMAAPVTADELFQARLVGQEEVPAPVVTDTTGSFRILFNNDETSATFDLRVRDGIKVTQAHLHFGELCPGAGAFGYQFHDPRIIVSCAGKVPQIYMGIPAVGIGQYELRFDFNGTSVVIDRQGKVEHDEIGIPASFV